MHDNVIILCHVRLLISGTTSKSKEFYKIHECMILWIYVLYTMREKKIIEMVQNFAFKVLVMKWKKLLKKDFLFSANTFIWSIAT